MNERAGNDIDPIFRDALAQGRGIFVGESHFSDIARFYLISRMQEFKEMGVATLFIELPHASVMALRDHGASGYLSYLNALQPSFNPATDIRGFHSLGTIALLIQSARHAGIDVIGYDPVNLKGLYQITHLCVTEQYAQESIK